MSQQRGAFTKQFYISIKQSGLNLFVIMADMRLARLRRLAKLGQLASLAAQLEEESKPKKKRIWVQDWIGRRPDEVPLFTEIQMEDEEKFFTNFRLSPLEFGKLLQR